MNNDFKRIVVKIGSNVLAEEEQGLQRGRIRSLVDQVVGLKERGMQVLLVSSGAVAAGRSVLPGSEDMNKVVRRQVLSAVGQTELMNIYQQYFRERSCHVAQVLATKEDFRDRRHYLNMKNCLYGLLRDDIVPILNENDVVSVTELMFTDNDELAGLVAAMVNAQALIILSSVDGVLTGPPGAAGSVLIPEIDPIDARFEEYILPSKSSFGRGGMHTKFRIARKAARLGITTFVANGRRTGILPGILSGKVVCTRFPPQREQSNVKKWLAHQEKEEKARLHVNLGAAEALLSEEKVSSLLPVGIERIEGRFKKGDIVTIWHDDEQIGIGLAQYGARSATAYLGQRGKKALVHYDYLLVTKR